jgi:formamidopyrimidine-DNA glycosylase
MPELPEVEVLKRSLQKKIRFLKIIRIRIYNRNLRYKVPYSINKNLKGRVVNNISRISKYLIFHINFSKKLLIHLGMTGTIHLIKKKNKNNTNASFYHSSYLPQKHNHIEISFSNNIKMIYNDPRRFGYLKLLKKNYLLTKPIINLGPDPFSYKFNLKYIKNFIYKKKINIKNLLMNQTFVGGIGNIYANEILYYCKLRPTKTVNQLSKKNILNIILQAKKVLNKAIIFGGSSIRDFKKTDGVPGNFQKNFKVYGKNNAQCPRHGCDGYIQKILVSSRSAFYCPNCQI